MAEKFYETCAKQVVTIIHQHREGTKEIADAIQKLNTDRRYSEYGREELLKKLREELNTINQEKTNELKEVVQQFVNTYQINITDDEKADPQEVANVLKVIEMCGTGLTAEVLRTALEPIKGSRSTLKMIETMFRSKNDRALALEASYNPECIDLLDDYIGRTGAIIGYEDTFAEVKSALNVPLLVSAGLHGEPDYNGSVINRLSDTTPYITLCLSDSMMKVGKLYEQVSLEYPGFSNNQRLQGCGVMLHPYLSGRWEKGSDEKRKTHDCKAIFATWA